MTTTQQKNLRFDQLLRSVFLLPRYQERYWTPPKQCQQNMLHVGVESMGGNGGREAGKEGSRTAPSQLVPGNRAAQPHQGSQDLQLPHLGTIPTLDER